MRNTVTLKIALFLIVASVSAIAQTAEQFELPCPNGSSPAPFGQTYNPVTNKFRAWLCIDVFGATATAATPVNQCDASKVADYQEAICVTTLTDAQIKSLPTTAATIVSAPVAGREIIPTFAMLVVSRPGGVDYTGAGVDGDYLLLTTGSAYATILNDSLGEPGSNLALLLAPGGIGTTYWPIVISTSPFYDSTTWGALVGIGVNLNSVLVSQALTLKATVAAGNFGGGNAANSMKVTVRYMVIPL